MELILKAMPLWPLLGAVAATGFFFITQEIRIRRLEESDAGKGERIAKLENRITELDSQTIRELARIREALARIESRLDTEARLRVT